MNSSEFILIKAYLTTLNSRHPIAAQIVNAYTFCIVWLVHFGGAASFYRDIVIQLSWCTYVGLIDHLCISCSLLLCGRGNSFFFSPFASLLASFLFYFLVAAAAVIRGLARLGRLRERGFGANCPSLAVGSCRSQPNSISSSSSFFLLPHLVAPSFSNKAPYNPASLHNRRGSKQEYRKERLLLKRKHAS